VDEETTMEIAQRAYQVPVISRCIPTFLPVIEADSSIIPLLGFMMISLHLPSFLKLKGWKRLFSIDHDGSALQTLYQMVEDIEETVILIQDEDDCIFGSFQREAWKQ